MTRLCLIGQKRQFRNVMAPNKSINYAPSAPDAGKLKFIHSDPFY